jgi:16S rRNA (adenine1518-N6/adenine1519-N6)-dimethyltransferase
VTVRRRFGQHFLEPAWVHKLITVIQPDPSDTVLEIGSGRGAVTLALAPKVRRIVAVEIDRELAGDLAARHIPSVHVVEGNFLDMDLDALLRDEVSPVRVIGNLPYNISSPILFRLLGNHRAGKRFSDATLMLQAEVANRVVSAPGGSDYGVLALQTALHADATRILTLPPGAFRPPPKVTSAVVSLRFRPPTVDAGMPGEFERLVRGMFMQRRKTLLNALRPVTGLDGGRLRAALEAVGIDPDRRPETLRLDEAAALVRTLSGPPPIEGTDGP